jgi:type I restriction enzyme M protein
VYDPTCGSGSLLLRVAKEVKEVGYYYGQEKNPSTYNLARMNMLLHGVHYRSFDIQQDDTLEHPQHIGKQFEAVVANPPFSANWSANPAFMQDARFSDYGKLAPASKADLAFVQHMLNHLADDGTMAVVLPHGVLFRGAAEGHIRRFLIEKRNWLDAVIGLPANVFYGTSIPTCILVFKKQRQHADNILFIDASQHFAKATNQNYLRDDDLERVLVAVEKRQCIEKYAYVASLQEIAEENEYNLNVPRYVDTFDEDVPVDLTQVAVELNELDLSMVEIDKTISDFCKELGIDAPFKVL